ncbi:hypothetical protein FA13DRAFT_1742703 [Coprinellus micaceus]|uniref:Osmotin, thaumatin-like protein n=1 Tax=Coprinellus micaceus TaxID=71717 RepID=A0A4Y7SG90_COPMI|nr:hypothetical protein FA13DRAFT_1742703 [Coprinellus micaceus]
MHLYFSLLFLLPITIANGSITLRQTPPTQYIIVNNCPTALPLFIAGDLVDTIPFQGSTTKFRSGDVPFINTNANGGSINSTGTLRAGFKANGGFYYFVKDPNRINTGIKVEPQHQLTDTGFCVPIICEDVGCSNSFTLPPNDQTYPPTGPIAPTPPFYQCPFSNVTYVVTFCPSGNWAT